MEHQDPAGFTDATIRSLLWMSQRSLCGLLAISTKQGTWPCFSHAVFGYANSCLIASPTEIEIKSTSLETFFVHPVIKDRERKPLVKKYFFCHLLRKGEYKAPPQSAFRETIGKEVSQICSLFLDSSLILPNLVTFSPFKKKNS